VRSLLIPFCEKQSPFSQKRTETPTASIAKISGTQYEIEYGDNVSVDKIV
jgi:hypothetical protein